MGSRSWFLFGLMGLFGGVLGVLPATAQASGSISGTVRDSSGAGLSAVTISIRNVETDAIRTTATDDAGRYRVLSLPAGEFEVRVAKPGFAAAARGNIELAVSAAAEVNFVLRVATASEQVVVTSEASAVTVNSSDVSGVVGEREVKDLPLNGRSYDLLLTLNPGIVNFTSQKTGGTGVSNSTTGNNFAVSGNRPQQNMFLLNGVEYTGAAENNMQPGGASQQLLGVEAVREFNVLRDSYGAAYGKHPGGQVVIVTQSGSNQWHGSAYEFLRNNAFDARNFFDDPSGPPPFQRNQFGASLGGPIEPGKTFAFANYEGYRQHLHQTSVAFVPSLASRAAASASVQPLLNLWPTPAAGAPDFSGISPVSSSPLQTIREDFGTLRLDHALSGKDTLNAVYTVDDGADFTATPANPFSADILTLRQQVLSLEQTHIFSASLLDTATLGFSRAGYFFTGEPTAGTAAESVPGFLAGRPVGAVVVGGSAASNPVAQLGLAGSNNGSNLSIHRNLFTLQDRLMWTRGAHTFSAGVWFQPFQSNETIALSQFGQATFTSLQTFLQGNIATFLFDPAPTEMNWRSLFGAWYAEDSIQLSRKLTLTLGFRDEFSTGWNEAHGRAANYTFTNGVINTNPHIGSSLFTENNAKFLPQPRIGVAWSPFGAKTVFRAGFGIYNDLQDALGYRADQNAPFNPVYSLSLPVSSLPIDPAAPIPAAAKLVPGGVQPDMDTPTLISWSLRIAQELTPKTVLTIGYLGSHGYHELLGLDANTPIPTICPAAPCPATLPTGAPVPSGTFFIPAGTPRANNAIGPTWTWFSLGTSSYNALQIELNRRLGHGLAFRGLYSYSKALDDGDSLNQTAAANAPGLVANPLNIKADWGLATYDVRHVGVLGAVYELPFGPGKTYGSGLQGISGKLTGGWSVNSVVTMQGGLPFTPQLSYNPSNDLDTRNPVRPFANPNFTGPIILGNPNQWFNPAAFLQPPPNSGFQGNLGRNTLIGPSLATWDFSLLKRTSVAERCDLEFRAEFFNFLNHTNFNTPNLLVFTPAGVSGTAGAITSTATSSRQIQFGLKLLW
jgi:hypothetical protein